jgi:hypothetical protein
MGQVFLYSAKRLGPEQVRSAVEVDTRHQRNGQLTGWVFGPGKQGFIHVLDAAATRRENSHRKARFLLSATRLRRCRIRTAIEVYFPNDWTSVPDIMNPQQILGDGIALEHANLIAHRLNTHGHVVIRDADTGLMRPIRKWETMLPV